MKQVSQIFDRINKWIGKSVSWLTLILVLVIIADVFMRYAFNTTSAASFELEWHLFALIFLLSAGWTLQQDKHVRVDVFYQDFSERNKAWVNLIGATIMLLPLCIIGCLEGIQFAVSAYRLGETSPDPGGLPARFVIKSAIPFGFFLLGLQGISSMITNIQTLLQDKND